MSIRAYLFRRGAAKSDAKRDAAIPLPTGVTEFRNISYGSHGEDNLLDVYVPEGTNSPLPTIVSIHGGGYVYGSKGYIKVPHFFGAMEFFVHVNGEERRVQKPSIGDGFEEEIEEVCACIRNGKMQSDVMPMSESIRITEIMDTVREQIGVVYPFER